VHGLRYFEPERPAGASGRKRNPVGVVPALGGHDHRRDDPGSPVASYVVGQKYQKYARPHRVGSDAAVENKNGYRADEAVRIELPDAKPKPTNSASRLNTVTTRNGARSSDRARQLRWPDRQRGFRHHFIGYAARPRGGHRSDVDELLVGRPPGNTKTG